MIVEAKNLDFHSKFMKYQCFMGFIERLLL